MKKIEKFESWTKNEAKVSKPHDPFYTVMIKALEASGIEYTDVSSNAQMVNGNPAIQIQLEKGYNKKLIKEILDEWGLSGQETVAYESGYNHVFNIYRRGGIRVDSSASDLATFSLDLNGFEAGAEEAIAWIRQYISKKFVEGMCSRISPEKYVKLSKSSGTLDPEFIKNVCTSESVEVLKRLKSEYPETYKFMSPYILYTCVFLTKKVVTDRQMKSLKHDEFIVIEKTAFQQQLRLTITMRHDESVSAAFMNMTTAVSRAKGEKTLKADFDGSYGTYPRPGGEDPGFPPIQDSADEKLWKDIKNPKNWLPVDEFLDLKKTHITAAKLGLL